jgi:hypothetical protein
MKKECIHARHRLKDGCLTFVKKWELQTVQYVVLIVDSDKKEACGEEYKIL